MWNSEDPVDNRKASVTAMWITDEKPKYFEGIPVGDYILEELETPGGYIPASMEITVEETGNLQSFVLKDDHTKLEVFKLERIASGEKEPLSWPAAAEFVLCEAVLDENGEQRRKTALICTGKTESWTAGRRMICRNMFRRFQRRMKRCLDSMEMNSGSSRGKRNFREESLQEMPDFWRIWRRKTEKSSHRSGNYRMEAECGSQSQLMEIRKINIRRSAVTAV